MFFEFPGLGGRLDSMGSPTASSGRLKRMTRMSRFFFLPIILLALGGACSHHHDSTTSPGTIPTLTTGPSDATTVSGRDVSLAVIATGAPTLSYQWAKDGVNVLGALGSTFTLYSPKVQDSGHYTVKVSNSDGSVTSSPVTLTVLAAVTFTKAVGIVSDASGTLYVSDMDDHTIWMVNSANQKTLLAGSSGLPGSADGKGALARFFNPGFLALDPAGNLVVADMGNNTIRRIAPDGTVTTLAGTPGTLGSADGVGALARFNAPVGLAVTGTGVIYIADSQNHCIRSLAADGTVTTLAGMAGSPGTADGVGISAQFNQPNSLALAADGTLVVADFGNSRIRSISQGGVVSTLAGNSNLSGFVDGISNAARFNLPVGLTIDATNGIVWVADTHNHAIRRLTLGGTVSTLAGSGATSGNADGTGTAALFNLPCGIATTPSGNLIVSDTHNHILRVVTPSGTVTTLTTP